MNPYQFLLLSSIHTQVCFYLSPINFTSIDNKIENILEYNQNKLLQNLIIYIFNTKTNDFYIINYFTNDIQKINLNDKLKNSKFRKEFYFDYDLKFKEICCLLQMISIYDQCIIFKFMGTTKYFFIPIIDNIPNFEELFFISDLTSDDSLEYSHSGPRETLSSSQTSINVSYLSPIIFLNHEDRSNRRFFTANNISDLLNGKIESKSIQKKIFNTIGMDFETFFQTANDQYYLVQYSYSSVKNQKYIDETKGFVSLRDIYYIDIFTKDKYLGGFLRNCSNYNDNFIMIWHSTLLFEYYNLTGPFYQTYDYVEKYNYLYYICDSNIFHTDDYKLIKSAEEAKEKNYRKLLIFRNFVGKTINTYYVNDYKITKFGNFLFIITSIPDSDDKIRVLVLNYNSDHINTFDLNLK